MRGLDPRDFTLLAYGGAGPLHAAAIAEELGITEIVIPPMPGAFSAYGLLTADTRYDVTRTRLTRLSNTTLEDLQALLEPLREEARERLRRDGFTEENIRLQVFLDIRFVGQAFELTTPMPDAPETLDEIAAAFQAVYEERYAQSDTAPAEIVSFRVVGLGKAPSVELPEHTGDASADIETRSVSFDSTFVETAIHRREALRVETAMPGPAIIEEDGATTVVPPGFNATLDRFGILTLRRVDNG
jgi:N-methylhydantoinase A